MNFPSFFGVRATRPATRGPATLATSPSAVNPLPNPPVAVATDETPRVPEGPGGAGPMEGVTEEASSSQQAGPPAPGEPVPSAVGTDQMVVSPTPLLAPTEEELRRAGETGASPTHSVDTHQPNVTTPAQVAGSVVMAEPDSAEGLLSEGERRGDRTSTPLQLAYYQERYHPHPKRWIPGCRWPSGKLD
jgi:hypothetical protein